MSAPAFLDPIATSRRRGGVVVFLAVAFAVTWAIWLPILVQARTAGLDGMPWTFFLASIGPACGAVAAALWEGGPRNLAAWARRAFSLRFPRVWWLAGIGMPVAYYLIGFGAAAVVAGGWPDPESFGTTAKLPGLGWPVVAVVWLLTFGLGEEAGWRGWLLPALSRRSSVFWSALVVAGIWIAWHAPAFFFNPTYTQMGVGIVGWMLALVCGSYLLAWMTLGARWSIVPVLLWHAGFDLLTAADQSAGVIASTISAIVMVQGVVCAGLLWRRRGSAQATTVGARPLLGS
ncbi:CPBP family intramembrane glutamic endopeptidase [Microbacterium sp. BR1]|uniref:CPBP family intramembrane glutamic endopeptidase n=1 Tax=Microbacterium sp. BR1 TaxID=1070896 RepID=UPI000C2C9E0C|nr:type II CAAX endopeptidase family protein [Microbacterium sp. BR1]